MNLVREDREELTVVRLEGALDAVSTPELRPVIDALVEERRPHVRLDVTQLRLIDSSGVGVIVSLYKRLHEHGGKLEIEGMRDQPLAIFRLLRLDRIFDL